jgi:hypothetical protein
LLIDDFVILAGAYSGELTTSGASLTTGEIAWLGSLIMLGTRQAGHVHIEDEGALAKKAVHPLGSGVARLTAIE